MTKAGCLCGTSRVPSLIYFSLAQSLFNRHTSNQMIDTSMHILIDRAKLTHKPNQSKSNQTKRHMHHRTMTVQVDRWSVHLQRNIPWQCGCRVHAGQSSKTKQGKPHTTIDCREDISFLAYLLQHVHAYASINS